VIEALERTILKDRFIDQSNTLYNVHTGFDEDYRAPSMVAVHSVDDLAALVSACTGEIQN